MKKIFFKDRPDRSTPVSAENLNLLQAYIEQGIAESKTMMQKIIGTLPPLTGWQNIKNFDFNREIMGSNPAVVSFRYKNSNNIWLDAPTVAFTQIVEGNGVVGIQLTQGDAANRPFEVLLIRGGVANLLSLVKTLFTQFGDANYGLH